MDKGLKPLLIKWINSEYFVDIVYKVYFVYLLGDVLWIKSTSKKRCLTFNLLLWIVLPIRTKEIPAPD